MDLLESIIMGAKHSYAQARDDATSLMHGKVNPGTLGRVMDIVQELPLAGLVEKVGAVASPLKNIIAKTSNPKLQGMYDELGQKAPKLMDRVQNLPEAVHGYLTHNMPEGSEASLGVFSKMQGPKGQSGVANVKADQSPGELLSTLAHELAHADTAFTARPSRSPDHMLETAQQLSSMMPPQQRRGMENYVKVPSSTLQNIYTDSPENLFQKLSGGILGSGVDTTPTARGGASPALAANEAFSYLTEALLNGGGDPALESIANALGRGIR